MRCLTRFGINISDHLHQVHDFHHVRRRGHPGHGRRGRRAPGRHPADRVTTATAATGATVSTAATATGPASTTVTVAAATTVAIAIASGRTAGRRLVGVDQVGAEALGHDFALVDPAFDADAAGRRTGLEEAVVDVGAQGVQRHATVRVAFGPRHLGTAEAAGDLDLDALGAGAHRRGESAFHRAPEGDAILQLLGDRLGDQFGVELGPFDLTDVDFHRAAGELVQLFAQRVDFRARFADHDARPGGMDVDGYLAAALDGDFREAGVRKPVFDVVADREVVLEDVGEVFLLEPVRLPVVDIADPESLGMDLLSHSSTRS